MKLVFSIVLCLTVLISTQAAVYASDTPVAQEEKIDAIPDSVLAAHQMGLTQDESNVSTASEFEILQTMKKMTDDELIDMGYASNVIDDIRSGKAEENMRDSVIQRAALPEKQLLGMGYTESEVKRLKALTGDETLEEIVSIDLMANCSTYNNLVSHVYKTSIDKTYFTVNYGWEWDKSPVFLLTDCIGVGWNKDFHPDDSIHSDFNVTLKTHVNEMDYTDKKYSRKALIEKNIQTAEDQFPMKGFYYGYYVKSGSGTMYLSQTGKVNDVKFSFKYGHNKIGFAPSVSFPWGVSFSLEGAEDIFQPPEIVYSDFATEE